MARRLEGRSVFLMGAGSASPNASGWSDGKSTLESWSVGEATAVLYARAGALVTCVDKNLAAAEATAAIIEGEGGAARALACDATQLHEVQAAVDAHVAWAGSVDILHNNVGIVDVGGPVETSEESFDRVMAANTKSVFLTCKVVLPIMERQGRGVIVNISSIASLRYYTVPWIGYNASKGAVNALTMGIAAQYASKNIRCNAIAPGLLSTPMVYDPYKKTVGDVESIMRQRDAAVPMGRQPEAWDVGYASVFLASDEARFITGQVLVVDGGSSLFIPNQPLNPKLVGE
jgi:NAD(P)-dependent dehydrogenase (short-subunit alcohol dehydrogenase family)